jgi:hypothetical protein
MTTSRGYGAGAMGIDPVADATSSLGAITLLIGVVSVGGVPSQDQIAAAQNAVKSIAQDLLVLARQPTPPTPPAPPATPANVPPGTWISAPVTALAAAGSAILGGIGGWYLRGRQAPKRQAREEEDDA